MSKSYVDYKLDELLIAINKNDKYAFAEFYHRYKKPLYLYGLKKLGNPDEVDDLLQDLFTSLWVNREKIDFNKEISSYLYVSLRNKIIDFIAKSKNRNVYEESVRNFSEGFENTTDFKVRTQIFMEQIDLLLKEHPNLQQRIFKMRFYQNMDNREIASELGISEKTVRNQLSILLKVLRVKIRILFFLVF